VAPPGNQAANGENKHQPVYRKKPVYSTQMKDSTGKECSLDAPQFKEKVICIAYVDPDEKDTSNHVEDALKSDDPKAGL